MGRNFPSPCLDDLCSICEIWMANSGAFGWAGFNKSRARRHLCFNLALLLRYPLSRIQWRFSGLIRMGCVGIPLQASYGDRVVTASPAMNEIEYDDSNNNNKTVISELITTTNLGLVHRGVST